MNYVIILYILFLLTYLFYIFYKPNNIKINKNNSNITNCHKLLIIANYYNYNVKNNELAIYYYKKILNKLSPNDYLYNLCNDKIKDINKSILYKQIGDLENINKFHLQEINNEEDNPILYINTINENVDIPDIPIILHNDIFDNTIYNFNNDNQNVHDTFLNTSIKESIKYINSIPANNISNDEIFNIIISKCDELDKDNIKNVLLKIKNDNIKNINTEMTNYELLKKIIDNIIIIENKNEKQNCYNFLITNLKDCISEENQIVCNVGIANRLIQSLSIANNGVSIKNKDLYKEEILTMIANLRNISEDNLKQRSLDLLKEEYINTKILQQYQLDDIINDWIDYI